MPAPTADAVEDMLGLGRRLLAALPRVPGWEAEVYLERETSREVAWAEGRPADVSSGDARGLAVRALNGGRQGFAYANEVSAETARRLWEQARAAAAHSPADRFRALAVPDAGGVRPFPVEEGLFKADVRDHRERLRALEKRILRGDRRLKKALKLTLSESGGESAVANSRGVAARCPSSAVSFAVELMGESRGEVQVSWDFAESRFWNGLDCEAVADRAREQVLSSFGGRALDSGRWPVVFAPRVGVEFLDLLSDALCADAVQRGRSFFAGKRGRAVASPAVTLIDDGRLPGGLASASHDDEGCPTQTTVLVEGGRLRDFLYDGYAARKERRRSTGNAARPGLNGPPAPEASNFYMKPGAASAAEVLAGARKAFLVQDVMGMHTADPVSGDFSVGATGRLVVNGRPGRAVKGVTLAGNLLDMFSRVDAVADDLNWYGAVGAPTFRVSGLSIGGAGAQS